LLYKNYHKGQQVRVKPVGNSMVPRIKSKQEVLLIPDISSLVKDDIVFCKVKGKYYLHKIYAIDNEKQRYLIGNNKNHINGWTKTIYGKALNV
jgi:phage repressor protein C with HTH and peptisase S24 domain